MKKGEDTPLSKIIERFWKEEIILTPCETCKKRKKCFSLVEISTATCEKVIDNVFERVRNCKIRNQILWGHYDR